MKSRLPSPNLDIHEMQCPLSVGSGGVPASRTDFVSKNCHLGCAFDGIIQFLHSQRAAKINFLHVFHPGGVGYHGYPSFFFVACSKRSFDAGSG